MSIWEEHQQKGNKWGEDEVKKVSTQIASCTHQRKRMWNNDLKEKEEGEKNLTYSGESLSIERSIITQHWIEEIRYSLEEK